MAKILIVDDDQLICELLSVKISKMGHEADSAHSMADGMNRARSDSYDVIFLDVMLPDGSGLDMVSQVRKSPGMPEVIIITGAGDPEGAEKAIKSGAWDYIEKGTSLSDMTLPLLRALQYRQEKMSAVSPMALKRRGIIGSSRSIQGCFDLLAQAAGCDANVLITGETGTGKEIIARAIHDNSSRSGESFVVVDCAALPESLVENMLFGHERGAFTGADRAQDGLVLQADGGTLFLDEVGELPLGLQKSFLRVLQEHRFRPLGGGREVHSNFRLVAATNRDLDRMVADGRFRQDLLFRLRALAMHLPPLREREGDIEELTVYYLATLSQRRGTESKGFSPDFLETLAAYDWPGNVRELFNALEQALTAAEQSPTLFSHHLPDNVRIAALRSQVGRNSPGGEAPSPVLYSHDQQAQMPGAGPAQPPDFWQVAGLALPGTGGNGFPKLRDVVDQVSAVAEREYLKRLLLYTGGEIKAACDLSGLSRTGLYNRLKKHGISRRG